MQHINVFYHTAAFAERKQPGYVYGTILSGTIAVSQIAMHKNVAYGRISREADEK